MITHGIVLARLGRKEEAQFAFQNAIELAHQADALSQAGIAALTLIEEIDFLKPDVLAAAYEKASEWLAKCHSQELLLRFKAAAIKLARVLQREAKAENVTDLLFHKMISLPDEVLKFERDLISTALAKANGRLGGHFKSGHVWSPENRP